MADTTPSATTEPKVESKEEVATKVEDEKKPESAVCLILFWFEVELARGLQLRGVEGLQRRGDLILSFG